jgi:hypothetical protein
VCEGKRDRIFLDETLKAKINLAPNKIKTFEEARLLEKAVMYGEKAPVLICEGKGFPGNTKVAVKLSCKFMRYFTRTSMGVIGDSDRGPVYNETTAYLTSYLGTHCRIHAMKPEINKLDLDLKAIISLDSKIRVTMWTFEVPDSLEKRVSNVLKLNYRELADCSDEDDVISRAAQILEISEDDVIRRAVSLLDSEPWFDELCKRAKDCMYLR